MKQLFITKCCVHKSFKHAVLQLFGYSYFAKVLRLSNISAYIVLHFA